MTSPIRYGRSVTMTHDGDVMTTTEQVYNNFEQVKHLQVQTEIVQDVDAKEILAIFLKLLDDQADGTKDMVGLQCIRNTSTGALRVEKSWIIPHLR